MLSGGTIAAETKDAAETKERISNKFMMAHANLFADSSTNLLKKRLDTTRVYEWQEALKNLQNYVKKNAGGNKKLLVASTLFKNVSYDIVDTVTQIYEKLFSPAAAAKSRDALLGDYTEEAELVSRLSASRKNLEKTADILKDTAFYSLFPGGQKKIDVKKMLLILIPFLQTTIERTTEDFNKILFVL